MPRRAQPTCLRLLGASARCWSGTSRRCKERRERDEIRSTAEERIAEAITRFTGSMRFVYLHLAFFGFWIVANLGWVPGVPSWDPSFVVLAMIASVEAIFLSTFVLISQNRMAAAADKRADLDLQISLLAEHEITKLVTLVSGIAERLGVQDRGRRRAGGDQAGRRPEGRARRDRTSHAHLTASPASQGRLSPCSPGSPI